MSSIFGHVKKRLDKNDKVNFKIYDVKTWETNNCNTHIAQYLKHLRQSDTEIWSVNRMWHEKHFSWNIIRKMWWRNYSQTLYWKNKIEYISAILAKINETNFSVTVK